MGRPVVSASKSEGKFSEMEKLEGATYNREHDGVDCLILWVSSAQSNGFSSLTGRRPGGLLRTDRHCYTDAGEGEHGC